VGERELVLDDESRRQSASATLRTRSAAADAMDTSMSRSGCAN
jgi:hypothetical protein